MALNKRPIHGVPEANAIIHINHTINMLIKAIKIHFFKDISSSMLSPYKSGNAYL